MTLPQFSKGAVQGYVWGCVTTTVSSRVIRSPALKIEKNVKNVEMDHNGAYLCDHELSEQMLRRFPNTTVLQTHSAGLC